MKKLKKNIKPILILMLIAILLSFAFYGLFSLIHKLTSAEKNSEGNDSQGKNQEPLESVPKSSEQFPESIIDKNIKIEFNENIFTVSNTRGAYSVSNKTGFNELVLFIENSSCTDIGLVECTDNNLIDFYNISEEKNGILVTVSIKKPFTFDEKTVGDDLHLSIQEQVNSSVLEYRNDLSRIYLNINKARLSQETDSFIKNYTEIYDETNKIHTLTIPKNLMPSLKNETINLNDGTLKKIEIINRSEDIQIKFSVYEKIVIYPNTRDYDSAITFIKPKTGNEKLIVIDPGHGGIDGGTTSKGEVLLEKNLVLQISKFLYHDLLEMGFSVIILREEDIYLGLMERTDISNLAKADLIVSVHINSYKSSNVNGLSTYYKTSDVLAEMIHNAVLKETGANDMGTVKAMELSILNRAELDSVLVETGFITNDTEAALLNTEEYQKKLASGMSKGIAEYFGKD